VYAAEIVPTFILAQLPRRARGPRPRRALVVDRGQSRRIRVQIDLQVQNQCRHATPAVISMVGTMRNLVTVRRRCGQPLRNTLQAPRPTFHRTPGVQNAARGDHRYLSQYQVETKGVYIQDVVFPRLVRAHHKEIANQEKATFEEQQRAETSRIEMEKAKGTADMQSQLASAQVGVQIKTNEAQAREAEARGEAAYVRLTGEAEAARTQAIGLAEAKATEALGLARATGFEAQKDALGGPATAVVAVANAVADGHNRGPRGARHRRRRRSTAWPPRSCARSRAVRAQSPTAAATKRRPRRAPPAPGRPPSSSPPRCPTRTRRACPRPRRSGSASVARNAEHAAIVGFATGGQSPRCGRRSDDDARRCRMEHR
jgi:regulator of protease activity HflC (stomatin/prohibitin superfamily)